MIALFSFAIAPLLHFAAEGLWQVIRIFTGFYNIPTVAIVIIGLFTRRVPALGAKIAIVFHVLVYGLLRFVLDDIVTLHFLHQYALLFLAEIAIMLFVGWWKPREHAWTFSPRAKVDMTPWRYARPLAVTLFSCVVALYVVFSPLGLASPSGNAAPMAAVLAALALANAGLWVWAASRARLSR